MPRVREPKGKGSELHALYRGKIAPQNTVLRGMVGLEKQLAARSARDWARQLEATQQLNRMYAPLRELSDKDKQLAQVSRGIRERHESFRRHKLVPASLSAEKPRIYLGSLGAVVPPPYDYAWTFHDPHAGVGADKTTGQMGFNIDSFGSPHFNSSADAAVGIYFRSITEKGRLSIWSDPSFAESWYDYAYFAASHSNGFIGLYVGSYDDNWNFTGALVHQQHSLWSDDSHLSDSGHHEKTNPGYSLNATCNVDSSHQYVIWVWTGGRAAADEVVGGASAGSALSVSVPWIIWELT
jgi:hypothetical protein